MSRLVCKSCKVELDPSHVGPCPVCNQTGKLALQDIGVTSTAKTSLVLEKNSASRLEGMRVVDSDGRSSAADWAPAGFGNTPSKATLHITRKVLCQPASVW